jgi:hypothetical protein
MPFDLTERRIRRELVKYLVGHTSLDDFYAWFTRATLVVTGQSPRALRELVYGIKLYLAEYSRAHRTEAELRQLLFPVASTYRVGDECVDWPRSFGQNLKPKPLPIVSPGSWLVDPERAKTRHERLSSLEFE